MEKTTFPRQVEEGGEEWRQFSGKITIESVEGHDQGPNAVLVNIMLDSIVATPEGFGSALGMAARQYMDNLPAEHHAAATLALFMALQKCYMRQTALPQSAVPS